MSLPLKAGFIWPPSWTSTAEKSSAGPPALPWKHPWLEKPCTRHWLTAVPPPGSSTIQIGDHNMPAKAPARALLHSCHIRPSMSAAGNCYDNAAMESFWSTLKTEWLHHKNFPSHQAARLAIFDYIETFLTLNGSTALWVINPLWTSNKLTPMNNHQKPVSEYLGQAQGDGSRRCRLSRSVGYFQYGVRNSKAPEDWTHSGVCGAGRLSSFLPVHPKLP